MAETALITAFRSMLIDDILPYITKGLNEDGIDITTDKLAKYLDVPYKPQSNGSNTTKGLKMPTPSSSNSQVLKKGKELPPKEGGGCVYKTIRGVVPGKICGNRCVGAWPLCKTCLRKKNVWSTKLGLSEIPKPEDVPPSNVLELLSKSDPPKGKEKSSSKPPVPPAPSLRHSSANSQEVGDVFQIDATHYDKSKGLLKDTKYGFIFKQFEDDVIVYCKDVEGKLVELNDEDKRIVKNINMIFSEGGLKDMQDAAIEEDEDS